MWLFRKKKPKFTPVQQLRVPESWTIYQGMIDNKPLLARFNTGAKSLIGHPELDHQVGIAIPLIAPDSEGMPAAEENVVLATIEDTLVELLCVQNESVLVGVITTSGMREFVFYTADPQAVIEKVEGLGGTLEAHQVQLMIQPDKEWSVYRRFVS